MPGLNLGLGLGLSAPAKGVGVALHPTTAQWVARMTMPPSFSDLAIYDDFVTSVADILATRDIAYILAAHDQQAMRLNIPNTNFTCTIVGAPAMTPYQGVTGKTDGTAYLNTGYLPDGTRFMKLQDAELDVFCCDNTFDANNGSMAEVGNDYNLVKALETTLVTGAATTIAGRITRNVTQRNTSGAIKTAIGLTSVVRSATTDPAFVSLFKNGAYSAGGGGTAIGLGTTPIFVGASSATPVAGSLRRLGFASGGAKIPNVDRPRWYNAIALLLQRLGAYNPANLNDPPVVGGPDPYAPSSSVAWSNAQKGAALDMASLTQTHDSTFTSTSVITPSGGAGPWFAPVRAKTGFAEYKGPDAPVSPFTIVDGVLRIRMEQVSGLWQTGHMQTSDTNGNGFSQTLGYWEAKIKMPAKGVKGPWPAFWLYGTGLYTAPSQTRPEIDVIEYYPGNDSRGHHATIHLRPGAPYVSGNVSQHWWKGDYTSMDGVINDGGWHTYGVEITNDWIIMYFDRQELERIPCVPEFRVPMHMLLTVEGFPAESGSAVSPIDMFVEYARAWQRS